MISLGLSSSTSDHNQPVEYSATIDLLCHPLWVSLRIVCDLVRYIAAGSPRYLGLGESTIGVQVSFTNGARLCCCIVNVGNHETKYSFRIVVCMKW